MSDGEPTLIYETLHGSHAYGLAREGSDTDLKGVVVGPRQWYFGMHGGPEQLEIGPDHVRYELRKLFRLAAACNPTLIELLWTEPEDQRLVTEAGRRLLDAREQFLSKRAKDTFGGYAHSQLKRIRTHRRWLLEPPREEPTRESFGLPERTVIPKDQLGAAETLIGQGRVDQAELTPNFLEVLDRERRYRQARKEWQQYRQWVQNRNPSRAALEAEHGYDTKHALHLVRLLRMALEILESGQVRVRRPDREELLAIRDGAWGYDELLAEADELSQRIERAAEGSPLPNQPDERALDELCVSIIQEVLQ